MNTDYALLVCFDWADQKHALCWREPVADKPHTTMLEHTPERINEWVSEQLANHPGGRIARCLEQKIGAVVHALMDYAELDLYPVNPATGQMRHLCGGSSTVYMGDLRRKVERQPLRATGHAAYVARNHPEWHTA